MLKLRPCSPAPAAAAGTGSVDGCAGVGAPAVTALLWEASRTRRRGIVPQWNEAVDAIDISRCFLLRGNKLLVAVIFVFIAHVLKSLLISLSVTLHSSSGASVVAIDNKIEQAMVSVRPVSVFTQRKAWRSPGASNPHVTYIILVSPETSVESGGFTTMNLEALLLLRGGRSDCTACCFLPHLYNTLIVTMTPSSLNVEVGG